MAAKIATQLNVMAPEVPTLAMPVVGEGNSYKAIHIPLILSGVIMPSGGFVRNGLKNWIIDLKAGLFELTRRQISAMRNVRKETCLAVCVGDVYCLLLAAWFLKRPIIFLPTAKSDYIAPHWAIEAFLMRRYSSKVFPRDLVTALSLRRHGISAEFVGNIMMDCLDNIGADLERSAGEWVIGILPGGRLEAYENMKDIALSVLEFERLLQSFPDQKANYYVALSGGLIFSELVKTMEGNGWFPVDANESELSRGIVGTLKNNSRGESPVQITVLQGRFANVLNASQVIIGMAGTGNEQAVGLGKPVVTFAGRGPQFTEKFLKIQKKLLGDSISVVPRQPEKVAQELLNILINQSVREKMACIGRERMGQPGGTERIVTEILASLKEECNLNLLN